MSTLNSESDAPDALPVTESTVSCLKHRRDDISDTTMAINRCRVSLTYLLTVYVCVVQGMSSRQRRVQRLPINVLRSRSRDLVDKHHAALRLQLPLVLLRQLQDLPPHRPSTPLPLTGDVIVTSS